MALISMANDVANKSLTCLSNRFITKYLPVLDGDALKVYVIALNVAQGGQEKFEICDFASKLNLSEEQIIGCFKYLEEFELVAISSFAPFKVIILDCENVSGTPKKYKAEKYSTLSRSIQTLISGRMIATSEFREYFNLIEDYGFDQNALLMIINYCVQMKGDNIRMQYIRKVAKNFAEDGDVTAKRVEERLSAYTSSTPALMRIFTAVGIKKQPDFDDDVLYKKWTNEMGFDNDAIIATAKFFKVKTTEKIDVALCELYKNKKFDAKEIECFCAIKNAVHNATLDVAKMLGVYVQTATPYVENYVGKWVDYGFELDSIKEIANFCFLNGKNSFDAMNEVVCTMFEKGNVTDKSVKAFIQSENEKVSFVKKILSECGLTRKVLDLDKRFLDTWISWNFSDEMIMQACKISAGKNNPLAYMNGVLSSWKNDGIFTVDKIISSAGATKQTATASANSYDKKAMIESHYAELRRIAEEKADNTFKTAMQDETYSALYKEINSLNIKLAFCELKDEKTANEIKKTLEKLEIEADERLKALGIDKDDFVPKYKCEKCKDTGYDKGGKQCECFKVLLK